MTSNHRVSNFAKLLAGAALALPLFAAGPALAVSQAVNMQQVDNIKKAAADIGKLQADKGANEALAAINACYENALPGAKKAETVTPELQACMMKDIAFTRMGAAYFEQQNKKGESKEGSPDPQTLLNELAKRITGMFDHFKMSKADLEGFVKVVDQYGMDAYQDAVLPKDGASEGGKQ